ncbi:MAG TPA: DUF6457 domain-containing protein [Candidatus Sulfotelmatobacter sp.]|nr:DUF6457 domain-containing protein [Candidatus Sulfotelmatobacter sp.]
MAETWAEEYAAALEAHCGKPFPDDVAAAHVVARLLDLARDVAHGSERKNAPLAAYLAGRYVALRQADGVDVETALREAESVAKELMGH